MKNIKATLILTVSLGIFALLIVKLYLHLNEQEYRREQAKNIIPLYDPNNLQPFTDLRYPVISHHRQKLSESDLKTKYDTLLTRTFDTLTPWPPKERMPEGFNPRKIITMGQDPGLGIKELHRQGITGKGVKAAIIDFPLLQDHEEYKENLAGFHFVSSKEGAKMGQPAMHGTATASSAGKSEYTFWAEGGMSWAVPYLAGVITLAYQVNPNVQPVQMLQYLEKTGIPFNKGWIVNPKGLVEKVKMNKKIHQTSAKNRHSNKTPSTFKNALLPFKNQYNNTLYCENTDQLKVPGTLFQRRKYTDHMRWL